MRVLLGVSLREHPVLMADKQESVYVLGIRRETGSRWERRVPVAPNDVRRLVNRGIRVLVQPSSHRVFTDEAYLKAGAELSEDLSEAGTIIGVKEVPKELLLPNKTYLFFSHTIKAQPYNMEMLDEILAKVRGPKAGGERRGEIVSEGV